MDSTEIKSSKWFITLPLRFTHLQNNNTMLSGIKIGRSLNPRFNAALSIYHSFYLKSFKSEANLSGFDEQPRLFINAMAMEWQYYFLKKQNVALCAQLLSGWGFIKYDGKEQNFRSKQVNYFALEPAVQAEFAINQNTLLGVGLGYRPLLGNKNIRYTATNEHGELPVHRDLPNGITIMISLIGKL